MTKALNLSVPDPDAVTISLELKSDKPPSVWIILRRTALNWPLPSTAIAPAVAADIKVIGLLWGMNGSAIQRSLVA